MIKECVREKEMLRVRIPYLIFIPHVSCTMLLDCSGYLSYEQRPHTPLEVVAHLPCCHATLAGLTLL
jgi:hypothetical protein